MGLTAWLPRADLEYICKVSPIQSAFDEVRRMMVYDHNGQRAEFEATGGFNPGEFFDKEIECCKEAFSKCQ